MGASRLQIWREIELPLAMPGILIGMLLTFVLAVGAVAEFEGPRRPVDHRHHPRHRDRLHLRAELAARLGARGAADARRRRADAARHRPARPRPHPRAALMDAARAAPTDRPDLGLDGLRRPVVYLPIVCGILASLGKSRYFRFPVPQFSLRLVAADARLDRDRPAVRTSLKMAAVVTLIAVVVAFFGALAYARYDWQGPGLLPEARAAADLLPAAGDGPGAAALVQRARAHPLLADGGLRASGLDRAGGDAGDGDPDVRLRPGAGGGRLRPRRDPRCRCCAR